MICSCDSFTPHLPVGKHTQHPVQPIAKELAHKANLKGKNKTTPCEYLFFLNWISESQGLRICETVKYGAGDETGKTHLGW